eukprot:scaffold27736_cov66-Skeletonema_marinoi.AAC.1
MSAAPTLSPALFRRNPQFVLIMQGALAEYIQANAIITSTSSYCCGLTQTYICKNGNRRQQQTYRVAGQWQ